MPSNDEHEGLFGECRRNTDFIGLRWHLFPARPARHTPCQFHVEVATVEGEHGIHIKLKDLSGAKIQWRAPMGVQQLHGTNKFNPMDVDNADAILPAFANLCEATVEPMEVVSGSHMCAISA